MIIQFLLYFQKDILVEINLCLLTIQCFFYLLRFFIHGMFCNNERFMPSTSPFVNEACEFIGFSFKLKGWQKVIVPLFINSVPLSVTKNSGKPNFAIQCS